MEQKDSSLTDLRILSLDQAAELGGFSKSHLLRMAKEGNGPKISRIGKRRVGITVKHYSEWLSTLGLIFSTRKPAADATSQNNNS